MKPIKIGILNLMHDKEDTQKRFEKIFKNSKNDIKVEFFYPKTKYQDKEVPENVKAISQPLDLTKVADFDGFIITGAPIEHFDFKDVTYIEEIRCLLSELDRNHVQQLYLCWGAMAALNYFYGIKKVPLSQKIFGIYPNEILKAHPLLAGLSKDFLAPHARYADMDIEQIAQDPRLEINSLSKNRNLLLVTSPPYPERTFLFAHLEYGRNALRKEYQREINAHPERNYQKPENYFSRETPNLPEFKWKNTQEHFFKNWINELIKEKNYGRNLQLSY
ncbi:homoserine O-succinyltransferase [Lactobacillus sp. PV037]|uniref:homoserine O-acetyltransferase/O-succinyltransferase family protein n=1 Tax=unclassified Lactobacillus TaxID=2620435 RepID=UPI00223FE9D3|nr:MULTISPECIES: homoserine O-succinyltransferase [unclassified Lactobacillus]QNQ81657.1 homoserine O-succinyltransferase [Lactobacillus sp. PV012]QNQ84296.1 homoserine O-succinyltransferase [Lactobacillus sp. PV037]